MGLRYEYNAPAIEVRGDKIASWDPGRGMLVYPGEIGRGVIAPYRRDFSPRIGFAYRVKDKTVVRGAYGIFWNSTMLLASE